VALEALVQVAVEALVQVQVLDPVTA